MQISFGKAYPFIHCWFFCMIIIHSVFIKISDLGWTKLLPYAQEKHCHCLSWKYAISCHGKGTISWNFHTFSPFSPSFWHSNIHYIRPLPWSSLGPLPTPSTGFPLSFVTGSVRCSSALFLVGPILDRCTQIFSFVRCVSWLFLTDIWYILMFYVVCPVTSTMCWTIKCLNKKGKKSSAVVSRVYIP